MYLNEQREKLNGMILNFFDEKGYQPCIANELADHLIDGGVVVLPCQLNKPIYFIYNGKVLKDIPCKLLSIINMKQSPGFARIKQDEEI